MSNLVAILIWLGILGSAALQGIRLHLAIPTIHGVLWITPVAALVPLAVSIFLGRHIGGYPFDIPKLRKLVDSRFGSQIYAEFMHKLKPLLLFAVASIIAGGIGLYRSNSIVPGDSMAVVSVFYVCSGLGFIILRTLLKRRRLSME